MASQALEFVIDLLVRHVDVLHRRDAIDDQFGLHVILGAVFLAAPQRHPVQIHGARVNALRSQRAHHALKSHIHLMLDERFGHRKVVELHDFSENLFVQQFLVLVITLMLQALADFFPEFVQGSGVADILREIVVQFGQLFRLDTKYLDGAAILFAGQLGVRIVGGIVDVKALVIAGTSAFQISIELLHGFFSANMAKNAIGLQRIAAALRCAEKLHLGKVAVRDGAALDRRKGCGTLAQLFERFRHVLVRNVHRGHLELQALVVA